MSCEFVRTDADGTSWCALADVDGRLAVAREENRRLRAALAAAAFGLEAGLDYLREWGRYADDWTGTFFVSPHVLHYFQTKWNLDGDVAELLAHLKAAEAALAASSELDATVGVEKLTPTDIAAMSREGNWNQISIPLDRPTCKPVRRTMRGEGEPPKGRNVVVSGFVARTEEAGEET